MAARARHRDSRRAPRRTWPARAGAVVGAALLVGVLAADLPLTSGEPGSAAGSRVAVADGAAAPSTSPQAAAGVDGARAVPHDGARAPGVGDTPGAVTTPDVPEPGALSTPDPLLPDDGAEADAPAEADVAALSSPTWVETIEEFTDLREGPSHDSESLVVLARHTVLEVVGVEGEFLRTAFGPYLASASVREVDEAYQAPVVDLGDGDWEPLPEGHDPGLHRTDPATNRQYGELWAAALGFTGDRWTCLDMLWFKESTWNERAINPTSGAYGIPQALPATRMETHGDDWEWNPITQIAWGVDYIVGRYGDPCSAWAHWQAKNWY